MPSPIVGVIAFSFLVVLLLTSGFIFLVNARRVHAWSHRQKLAGLRQPALWEVRAIGAAWTVAGLFCIFGVVHWASQL